MNPLSDTQSVRRGGIKRGRVTLYCYLMYGFFMYLLTIQGNIIPFLRSELHLGYGSVSLHSSAFAAGGIATGVFGDRLIRRYGRRRALWLGVLGMSAGAALLCLASAAWASIGSCALMGALGGLIWIVVNAVLAELHGDRRSVAYAEASAVAYAFGIVAPLAMSLCLSLSLGWRNAVLLGVAFGGVIVLWFGRASLSDAAATSASGHTGLPASYWACWCALVMAVAIEFCILLWAPEFLEHVAGLSKAPAAAVFGLAMLVGRTAGSGLLQLIAAERLFPLAIVVTLLGFLMYWGLHRPPAAIVGLFLLGLGVALLYPLTLGFAMGAAGARGNTASARAAVAGNLALLVTPGLLGAFADKVGLHLAHLMVPGLVLIALICFVVAQILQRRTKPTRLRLR
jgi:MFS transporter, DHA1 family, inner membrane transport protein